LAFWRTTVLHQRSSMVRILPELIVVGGWPMTMLAAAICALATAFF
jgi:hypothetical protein